MLKTVSLLLPLYVTVFWVILLNRQKDTHSTPRSFLAKLMFLFLILNISRFFQLEPLPECFVYVDILYLYAGTLGFPLYHIYFRLLTVDQKFTWNVHYRFLILPLILSTIYLIAVFLTPYNEYKLWLFDRAAFLNLPQIRVLKILRIIILLSIEIQAIYYLILNTLVLKKYSDRAEQFYSNMVDGKYNNAKTLNLLVIFNCLIHVVAAIDLAHPTTTKLVIYSVLYAIDYYMMGYMGYRQKAINPTFEVELDSPAEKDFGTALNAEQRKILNKMLTEFELNKIHLNSELTILDITQIIGTNRTYLSSMINQEYNQNFCAFVNGYRMRELERIIHEDDDHAANELLAEKAGFGSVISMKRAISAKTGLSIPEWKKQILVSELTPI